MSGAGINLSLSKPSKVLMASPPLTYGALGITIMVFILSGLNGAISGVLFFFLQGLSIVATTRDPDAAYVWIAWGYVARWGVLCRNITFAG